MAKGLTNAAVPMGAVAVSRPIHDDVVEQRRRRDRTVPRLHLLRPPAGSAAGLATLDLYAREGLFDKGDELGAYWADAAHSLRGKPHVIDVRNIGLIAGIELEPRPGAPTKRATELFHACFDNGLLVRATGDIIAL